MYVIHIIITSIITQLIVFSAVYNTHHCAYVSTASRSIISDDDDYDLYMHKREHYNNNDDCDDDDDDYNDDDYNDDYMPPSWDSNNNSSSNNNSNKRKRLENLRNFAIPSPSPSREDKYHPGYFF